MKKALCILLSVCMLCAFCTPFAIAQENTRVEIRFRVGDSVLKINGTDVPVETPYVVGEGVTLVPLRVITEAFGATVDWDDDSQTVSLDYPGVNILLQIGNPIAEVNGRPEKLLAAPELPNSSTMVPLRFIAETFGATVSYDDATAEILVVKEDKEDAPTLEGGITSARIGDSYYGWSIENPPSFEMVKRSFDGLETTFVYNQSNAFSLTVSAKTDAYRLVADSAQISQKLSKYETINKEKDEEAETILLQAQDDKNYYIIYVCSNEKYRFEFNGAFEKATPALRDEALRIFKSCSTSFTEGSFDLSEVEKGFRTYTNETMQLKMKIPAEYRMTSKETAFNDFTFAPIDESDTVSKIHITVLSKTDTLDAKTLCAQDYESNKALFNKKYSSFTEPAETQYENLKGYEYCYTILGYENARHVRDVFWDAGDYIFNVAVTIKRPSTEPEFASKKIISGIESTAPDTAEVGSLIRNTLLTGMTKAEEGNGWKLQVPYLYAKTDTASGIKLTDLVTDATMYYSFTEDELERSNMSQVISMLRAHYYDKNNSKDVQTMIVREIDGKQIYFWEFTKKTENKNPTSILLYAMADGTHTHTLVLLVSELYRTNDLDAAAIKLLLSAEAK